MPSLLPKTPNLARDSGRERSLEEASPLNYRRPLTQATTFPASQKYSVRAGKEQSDAPASHLNLKLDRVSGREQSFKEASRTSRSIRRLTETATHPFSQSNPSVRAGKERSDAPASTQNNQLARASGREQSFEEASPLLTTHPS
jgi:hypothetical protein